jgi:D-3-phosphoglycerate dehydrogenase
VIGLGAIGVRVANAAKGIGMKVMGFDPHMTVEGAWALSSDVTKAGSIAEILANSDFVSLHLPLNAQTRRMINAQAIGSIREGTVLLNFAREGVVDEEAVLAALDSGRLGHYVTDFPTPRTVGHAKVIAFPHLGASTAEAEENCALMVADQLRDYLENGNVHNSVNFPSVRLARAGAQRLTVANRNVPNMIGQLSHVLGEAGANIAQMLNASRGEIAYNILDLDQPIGAEVVERVKAIEGILAVRVL